MNVEAHIHPRAAVLLTCMDFRIDVRKAVADLDLPGMRVYVVTNAGARATDEAMDSIAVAQVLNRMAVAETGFDVAVMPHTDCGAATVDRSELNEAGAAIGTVVGPTFARINGLAPLAHGLEQIAVFAHGQPGIRSLAPQTRYGIALWDTDRGAAHWLQRNVAAPWIG